MSSKCTRIKLWYVAAAAACGFHFVSFGLDNTSKALWRRLKQDVPLSRLGMHAIFQTSWLVATICAVLNYASAFAFTTNRQFTCTNRYLQMRTESSELSMAKTTLTDETSWRLHLLLNGLTTTQGKKLDGQLFVIEGKFVEEEGYEPPQGSFKPAKLAEDEGMSFELSNSYWKLSEDPNDPKDGLWVWGLFKEPLYPFMLLQIETKELKLPSSESDDNSKDSIPPLKLFAQISHIRDKDSGVELKTANLNVRVLERVQLPGASVDLYEEEKVGQISFQPL